MLKAKVSYCFTGGLFLLLFAGSVSSQGADTEERSAPAANTESSLVANADKYSFPELTEISRIEPIGLDIGGIDSGPMTNFRRAFFVDERAFVLQIARTGRYYLGILDRPSVFTGRCGRRPDALARIGGTYFLTCNRKGIPVEKLFIMEGTEQVEEITERLQR